MHSQRFLHHSLQIRHLPALLESEEVADLAFSLPLVDLLPECVECAWVLQQVVEYGLQSDSRSIRTSDHVRYASHGKMVHGERG
jgi:hypothetical protein